jgi:peptidoglycan/xylan/chitin deacetylase (PgdA/CDA1 family)/CelD/BcsL family acetyltransferase involved in cellulose biosynthesis
LPSTPVHAVPDRLLVLTWRSIAGDGRDAAGSRARAPAVAAQLHYLRQFATVVSLGPAMEALGTGQALPPRAVALTFDDGYRSHLEIAAPLLEQLGLPATFFLAPAVLSGDSRLQAQLLEWAFAASRHSSVRWNGATLPTSGQPGQTALCWAQDQLGRLPQPARERAADELMEVLLPETDPNERTPFLDWNGARQLVRGGFSFGSRSMDHHPIPREPGDHQLQELVTARRQLQEKLDVPMRLLAYPNGVDPTHNQQMLQAIRHAGYTHAFTTRAGAVRRTTPAYGAPRVAVPRRWLPSVSRARLLGSVRPHGKATQPRLGLPRPHQDRFPPVRLEAVRLEDVAEDLSRLALETRNVFATWEWLSTWWRHFGTGHRDLVTACRSADGEIIGVLPLYLWSSRPLQILRFIGHGAGDQLGPVYAMADAAAVADAMRWTLERLRWDIFLGDQLPAPALWSSFLNAKVLLREGNPVLHAPGDGWDGYLARRSSNFRQQLGRRERRLVREHRLAFRLVQDAEELPDALDTLFRLHALRWPEGSAFQAKEAFHRELAAIGFAQGWTRLWLLELDGEAVAAWYGLRFAGIESYYQAGRDPAWDHRSVGFVLLAHSIRRAFEDGMEEYRFLRGHEAYKYRFAEEDSGLETIALTRGPTAHLALSTIRRAYPIVKDRIGQLRWRLV